MSTMAERKCALCGESLYRAGLVPTDFMSQSVIAVPLPLREDGRPASPSIVWSHIGCRDRALRMGNLAERLKALSEPPVTTP
jgi:hypothetical protein